MVQLNLRSWAGSNLYKDMKTFTITNNTSYHTHGWCGGVRL